MAAQAQDKSFDNKAKKFQKNIYQTSKGRLREAVLWRDLDALLANYNRPLRILDVGGGQGQISVKLAQRGHHVTLNDLSETMLEQAKARAEALQVTENIEFIHGELQSLPERLTEPFDLVLCHAVFEWLANPKGAVDVLTKMTRPGGDLSLMFFNQHGLQMSSVIYGNFEYIERNFKVKKAVALNPQQALYPDDVETWLDASGFELTQKTGVRCFHDYMRDVNKCESAFDQILQQELKWNQTEPYASLGRYMHFMCKKRC